MKILTLNTHSLVEERYEEKLIEFVEMLKVEEPDVFALQEVNQSLAMPEVLDAFATGYIMNKKSNATIRMDNHAYRVAKLLLEAGMMYQWTWIPVKIGYDIYDEGIAVFSKTVFEDIEQFYISQSEDYNNWKVRKVLGVRTNNKWFYSVHMGWWNDEEEPFARQWDVFSERLQNSNEICYIMGDFNSPANKRNEGYDYVVRSGWMDTWQAAKSKDSGITVGNVIDGWQDKADEIIDQDELGMRIDFIFCNKVILVESSKVVCNGVNYPVVSDHYGVMIEVAEV